MAGKIAYVMGAAATTASRTDLVESVRSVLDRYDAATVDLAVEDSETVTVAVDDRLEIALTQLVENGIKHTDVEPELSSGAVRADGGGGRSQRQRPGIARTRAGGVVRRQADNALDTAPDWGCG